MLSLKPEYTRVDKKGEFRQLITKDFEQLYTLDMNKGSTWGGHWHTKGEEFFYVLAGTILSITYKKGDKDPIEKEHYTGDSFMLSSYEWHAIEALDDSLILKASTEKYNEESPDTFTGEIE